MASTKLSSKGQIVIPREVRESHRWREGMEFTIEEREGGILLRPKRRLHASRIEDLVGSLRHEGPPMTLEDMDAAVLAEARRRKKR
jgi:AbrB family looped-hinge helix DNA binding protein